MAGEVEGDLQIRLEVVEVEVDPRSLALEAEEVEDHRRMKVEEELVLRLMEVVVVGLVPRFLGMAAEEVQSLATVGVEEQVRSHLDLEVVVELVLLMAVVEELKIVFVPETEVVL